MQPVKEAATSPICISKHEEEQTTEKHNAENDLILSWKGIEEQLRCDICKQLLDVPVSLKCFHTFCSFCIRRYLELSGNDYCPCCRVPASSTDIRLEPRLAGILSILGKNRGHLRKQIRRAIRTCCSVENVSSRNEVFHKQADMVESFRSYDKDSSPIGRTLLPLYKTLKDKQLIEMVSVTDGLEVGSNMTRDDLIRLHKEFVFTLQSAHDAVRMGMFAEHPPTKEGLVKFWNSEMRLRNKKAQGVIRVPRHKTEVEKRREEADKSESVSALTEHASRRMQLELKERLQLARKRKLENSY
jgi:hypothetical protein